jgi:hypothetical protein
MFFNIFEKRFVKFGTFLAACNQFTVQLFDDDILNYACLHYIKSQRGIVWYIKYIVVLKSWGHQKVVVGRTNEVVVLTGSSDVKNT